MIETTTYMKARDRVSRAGKQLFLWCFRERDLKRDCLTVSTI